MKKIHIRSRFDSIAAQVNLSGSKSESNRVLIISSLCDEAFSIRDISVSKDTTTLIDILTALRSSSAERELVFDVGAAGTVMRFVTALLSITPGHFLITGSERMKKRPIGILVDALRDLGAEIEYVNEAGFPPLRIHGKKLQGGDISMNPTVSSQFVSAVLMIAPHTQQGVTISFNGVPVSKPYLDMTTSIMKYFGAQVQWNENRLEVEQGKYIGKDFVIEADWSSASYWYSIAALSKKCDLFLGGLQEHSLQGDQVLTELFLSLGVKTNFEEQGIRLTKQNDFQLPEYFEFDFSSCPDLAQTLACTCAALGIESKLTGLSTLNLKESRRIDALSEELKNFGIRTTVLGNSGIEIHRGNLFPPKNTVKTYADHRMAMAFAPLALVCKELVIEDPMVVEKSYPAFWNDLEHAGFETEVEIA